MKVLAMKTVPINNFDKVKIWFALDYPNIVRIIDYYETKNLVYLFMELCDLSLYEYMAKKGKFTESECNFIITQLLLAIQYLHSKDAACNNLKPENVLV